VNITPASPSEADALTKIAFAAKSHWGYPSHWMAQWQTILTVTPASIAAHETYVARAGECIIGFCALRRKGSTLRLEDLFVLPGEMRRGVGRLLFRHSQRRAREMGFAFFEIESDPNAAGFYERMGAERIGANTTMLDGQPRELPVFRCSTTHAPTESPSL